MRLGLRSRLMIGATLLVVAFVGVAVSALTLLTDNYTAEQVARETTESRASFRLQMDMRRDAWRRQCESLARSPLLLAMAAIPGVDAVTLADALAEMPAPVVAVIDTSGQVIGSRAGWASGQDLQAMPGLALALQGEISDHVWPLANGLVLLATAPLLANEELLGVLVCGERVDQKLAASIGALARRDVVLGHRGQTLGTYWASSELPPEDLLPLANLSHQDLPTTGQEADLGRDADRRPGLAMPLHEDGGVAFLSHQVDAIDALRQRARFWLLTIGGLLALIGILLAARIASGLTKPLRALTLASDRMGQGELTARVESDNMDPELGRLALSFNIMAGTVQALIADVTDKAARAEAANRAKDGFLTSISHELRTPLTGIQSTAELLQQFGGEVTDEERAEFLATILTEAQRLGQRISDALDFANLSGGAAQWTVGRVALLDACGQACQRLTSLLELKHVDFVVQCAPDVVLQGDREQITQATTHLLRNAWTWSPAAGQVDVIVHQVHDGLVIEVSDRGPGIPKEEQHRIFDSFTQGGDVLVDKPAGIGIGLKIAREVATMHGGAIEYSDRTGGGASFRMLLRLTDRPIDRVADTATLAPVA